MQINSQAEYEDNTITVHFLSLYSNEIKLEHQLILFNLYRSCHLLKSKVTSLKSSRINVSGVDGFAVPIFSVKSSWGRQITPFVNPLNQEN